MATLTPEVWADPRVDQKASREIERGMRELPLA